LLNPANTICDDQDLAKRMGVPGRSCSGLECDLAALDRAGSLASKRD
jgi:hypothetical protein